MALKPPSLSVMILGKFYTTVQQAVFLLEMGHSTSVIAEQLKPAGHRGNTQCQPSVIVTITPPGALGCEQQQQLRL